MKSEKGVTLATVVITVVIIVLISSTSILVGNRLILDAKEQKQEENYEAVVAAVNREIAKIKSSGIISPGIYTYIGIPEPVIGKDGSGDSINAGEGWFLLDDSSLAELGIKDAESTYLVNYDLGVVIDIENTEDLVAEMNNYIR